MKIGILAKLEGDPERVIPIIKDEDQAMAVFESWSDARDFAYEHILCRASICMFVDLENTDIRE